MGRPSKYKPEFCEEIVKFFTRDYVVSEQLDPDNPKLKKIGNTLPTFEKFAVKIGVCIDTMNEWTRVHEEFSDAYKKAKQLQKDMLLQNGLRGLYNPTFAIFTAKNITDMRDVQEIKTEVVKQVQEEDKVIREALDNDKELKERLKSFIEKQPLSIH